MIRTDTAACSHAFLDELTTRELGYSVGFYARADVAAAIEALPPRRGSPPLMPGKVRDGAWVASCPHLLRGLLAARDAGDRPQSKCLPGASCA